jgi:hypothetical protein
MSSTHTNYFTVGLIIIEVLCIGLFIALYVTAFSLTGDAATTTLSEMLSENATVRQLYLIFMGSYTILTFGIMFLVGTFDSIVLHDAKGKRLLSDYRFILYEFVIYSYYILALGKLTGFITLYFYDCNTRETEHYIFAGIGFGCAGLAILFLFFRRVILYTHHIANPLLPRPPYSGLLLLFDAIFVVTPLACFLLWLVIATSGIPEILASSWIVLEPCLLLWDFLKLPKEKGLLMESSLKPVVIYQVPKRQYLPVELYQRLLFYYNNKSTHDSI